MDRRSFLKMCAVMPFGDLALGGPVPLSTGASPIHKAFIVSGPGIGWKVETHCRVLNDEFVKYGIAQEL